MFTGFSGSFQQTIDAKNRIVIPSKFRMFIKKTEDRDGFILSVYAVGQDRCLQLYTLSAWQEFVTKAQTLAKSEQAEDFLRLLSANAEFANIDKQSRLVIPQKLVDFTGLKRDVMIIGVINRVEVWNLDGWKVRSEKLTKDFAALQKEVF